MEFDVGDYVWTILTKNHFPMGKYNKLSSQKIGPLEIIVKINLNAYYLKLPSHIQIVDVFNVKHLVPFTGDNSASDEDTKISRSKLLAHSEDDVDRSLWDYLTQFEHSKKDNKSFKEGEMLMCQ